MRVHVPQPRNGFIVISGANIYPCRLAFGRATDGVEHDRTVQQKSGCVVSITAALADRPIAGDNGSVSMITKGGLNSATQNLAIEYAKDGIRFNAVAPGVVDTPMHRDDPKDPLQPAMKKASVKDIVDAVLYLVQAGHVSGEILHVDGAAPARRW